MAWEVAETIPLPDAPSKPVWEVAASMPIDEFDAAFGEQQYAMSAEEADAGGLAGMAGLEAQPVKMPEYGPMEVVSDIPKAVPHAGAELLDLPGNIAGAYRSGEQYLKEKLPESMSPLVETAMYPLPGMKAAVEAAPEAGGFRRRLEEAGVEYPKTVPGQAATFGIAAAAGGAPGAVPKMAARAGSKLAERQAVKGLAKRFKKAGRSPDEIKKMLSLDDIRYIEDYKTRFPQMHQYGVKNWDEAKKVAGSMYDDLPKMRGMDAELNVTKTNPRTGMDYGKAVEELELGVMDLEIKEAAKKLMRPGAGPFTVRDRWKAVKALRNMSNSTKIPERREIIRKYIRELTDLELMPGMKSDALDAMVNADRLYAEAARLDDLAISVDDAVKGTALKETLETGVEKVSPHEVLKVFRELGEDEMNKMFGPKWKQVRLMLQQAAKRDRQGKFNLKEILLKAGIPAGAIYYGAQMISNALQNKGPGDLNR